MVKSKFLFLLFGVLLISFASAEYSIEIYADSVTGATGEVTVSEVESGIFKINATNGNYEIDRALVMKWLFYGTDGTNPRATSTYITNPTHVITNDTRDLGKGGHLFMWDSDVTFTAVATGSSASAFRSLDLTFGNTTNNNDVSSWSYLEGISNNDCNGGDCYKKYWEISGAAKNYAGDNGISDETGLDKTGDEVNNPSTSKLYHGWQWTGTYSQPRMRDDMRVVILSKGEISNAYSNGGSHPGTTVHSEILDVTDFLLDESFPEFESKPVVVLNSPEDELSILPTSITFNFSSSIPSGSLINASLYLNGILNETKSLSGSEDTQTFTKSISTLGDYNWSVKVCGDNSVCVDSETRSFSIEKYEITSNNYESETTEGSVESYSLNISIIDGLQISVANLVYDGVTYPATLQRSGQDYYIYKTLSILPVSSDVNKTFYWYITLNDATEITTDQTNQTISNINIDDCSVYSTVILNYTLWDEELRTSLNGSIGLDVDIYSPSLPDPIIEFSNDYGTDVHQALVCMDNELLNSDYVMSVSAEYSATDYVHEFNYIQDYELDSTTIPKNIKLYDLKTIDSQSFKITFKDNYFLPVENAIIEVLRKYTGNGEYEVVEDGLTDAQGQTVLHLVTEDVTYGFIVKKDGETLYTVEDRLAICSEDPCQVNLNQFESMLSIGDFEDFDNLDYTIDFNETSKEVYVIFSVLDSSTASMVLNVTKFDNWNNVTICSDSLVSSSGVLSCTIPISYLNSSILAELYMDNEFVTYRQYPLGTKASDFLGETGILMGAFAYLMLVFMAVSSGGVAVVIFAILGVIFVGLLGIISLGSFVGVGSIVIWFIVAGGIIIWKAAQR